MSRTPQQVSNDILAKLRKTAPALSLEIGTPERKIIDAVAEAISESYIDGYVAQSNWDIDSMSGSELESFVGIFGYGRLMGRRATGTVTFLTKAPAVQPMIIPGGTQVYVPGTESTTTVYYATVNPAIIDKGQTRVDVPAECLTPGLIGNVGVNRIIGFASQVAVASCTNNVPFTGGVDPETDEQLRQRFRNTLLRNIAGTEDFYRGLALQHEQISRVAVLGPLSKWREQIQVTSGKMTSTINWNTNIAKFIWPESFFVSTDMGQAAEEFYVEGRDYTVTTAIPPVFTVLDSAALPNNKVVDVEFDFTSQMSRNDPQYSITNKVDVYINGSDPVEVYEEAIMGGQVFNTSTDSPYNRNGPWHREDDAKPAAGNTFTRLGFTPIVAFPQTITVAGKTYRKGTDFAIVQKRDEWGSSVKELAGIEWLGTNRPAAGIRVPVSYTYNRLPEAIQTVLTETKQITTDPLVHVATYIPLRVRGQVMYTKGYDPDATLAQVSTQLSQWFGTLDFGEWIQISDVEEVIHSVPGIDNIRLNMRSDNNGEPFQYLRNGVYVNGHWTDMRLRDNELAVLHDVVLTRRSFNTFRSS